MYGVLRTVKRMTRRWERRDETIRAYGKRSVPFVYRQLFPLRRCHDCTAQSHPAHIARHSHVFLPCVASSATLSALPFVRKTGAFRSLLLRREPPQASSLRCRSWRYGIATPNPNARREGGSFRTRLCIALLSETNGMRSRYTWLSRGLLRIGEPETLRRTSSALSTLPFPSASERLGDAGHDAPHLRAGAMGKRVLSCCF